MRQKSIWVLVGMAIGAGIALLYAPQSGKQTRKLIRRKAEDARETIVETGEAVADKTKDFYSKSAKAVTEAAGSVAGLLHKTAGG